MPEKGGSSTIAGVEYQAWVAAEIMADAIKDETISVQLEGKGSVDKDGALNHQFYRNSARIIPHPSAFKDSCRNLQSICPCLVDSNYPGPLQETLGEKDILRRTCGLKNSCCKHAC